MPRILRIRYIPAETVDISGDRLLYRDEKVLVTAWTPIHPRRDIHHGMSCLFLEKGFKVSRFMNEAGETLYWYIDIVEVRHDPVTDTFELHDLLADVKIHPDGRVEIIDLDELAEALEDNLITGAQGVTALRILHGLLAEIRAGVQPSLAAEHMTSASDGRMGSDQ